MTEIFINSQLVDVAEDVSMPLNFAISDIRNPDKRASSYSKTIKLPSTPTNDALFTYIFEINGNIRSTDDTTNFTPDFNPNLKADCTVFIDSLQQFKGTIQLLNISNNNGAFEYELYLLGQIKNIFVEMGDKYITDLDFSEFDHEWTKASIVESWNDARELDTLGNVTNQTATTGFPIGSGYVYPIINYGHNSVGESVPNDPTTFNVTALKPATYVKTIIDKIFSENGFTYTSTFLNTDRFKRLVIPCSKPTLKLPAEEIENRKSYAAIDDEVLVEEFATNEWQTILPFDDTIDVYGATDIDDQWDNTNKCFFDVTKTGTYKLKTGLSYKTADNTTWNDFNLRTNFRSASYTVEATDTNTTHQITFNVEIAKYGITIYDTATNQTLTDDGAGNLTGDGTGTITAQPTLIDAVSYGNQLLQTITFAFNTTPTAPQIKFYKLDNTLNLGYLLASNNQQISGTYRGARNESSNAYIEAETRIYTWISAYYTVSAGADFYIGAASYVALEPTGNFEEGNIIPLNACLPEKVKQTDFFKSIINMFNLYIEVIGEKHLSIIPRPTFYSSTNTVDWTYKLDHSKEINIRPLGELSATEFLFTYKADKDKYNEIYTKDTTEIYGQKLTQINNDFKKSQSKTELIFSPTPLVGSSRVNWKIPVIVKADDKTGDDQPMESNIRILYYGGIVNLPAGESFRIYRNTNNTHYPYDYFGYAGHLDNPYYPLFDLCFNAPKELFYTTLIYTNNNLYNIYYKQFLEEITDKDSKVVSAYFYLTPQDINELDFRNYIFIDGTYYILQSIQDYDFNKNEVTKVELLKIKNAPTYTEKTVSTGIPKTDETRNKDVEIIEGGENELRDASATSEYYLIEGGENELRANPSDTDIIIINGNGGKDYVVTTLLVP